MSLCEHHPKYSDGSKTSSLVSEKLSKKLIIQDELIWGLSYRNVKKREKDNVAIPPKSSPVDIPFKLCREKQRKRRRKKSIEVDKAKNAREKLKNLSLLEKSVLSQSKYMDMLSIPNPKYEEPPLKKRKRRCEIEPCPPRFVQLAVPNKRRVLANWKDYKDTLPIEMILRFEQILHTDKNLDPRDARYYYKKIDKVKKKRLRSKRRLKLKKRQEKEKGDGKWLMDQIDQTKNVLMDYIKESPSFALNYKQLMLSDAILDRLDKSNILKKPNRTTNNHYKQNIIEVSDKLALWVDTLTRFVDIQAVESEEDIPPLTISSLGESEGESEGEESSSELSSTASEEETEGETKPWQRKSHYDYEGEEEGAWLDEIIHEKNEDIMTGVFRLEEGEDQHDFETFLGDLDENLLDKLISILGNCSDEFLDSVVNEEKIPGITYKDILEKLKDLKDELTATPKKTFLEEIIVDWAMHNEPDKVDDRVLKEIHEAAGLLSEWLYSTEGKKTRATLDETWVTVDGSGHEVVKDEDVADAPQEEAIPTDAPEGEEMPTDAPEGEEIPTDAPEGEEIPAEAPEGGEIEPVVDEGEDQFHDALEHPHADSIEAPAEHEADIEVTFNFPEEEPLKPEDVEAPPFELVEEEGVKDITETEEPFSQEPTTESLGDYGAVSDITTRDEDATEGLETEGGFIPYEPTAEIEGEAAELGVEAEEVEEEEAKEIDVIYQQGEEITAVDIGKFIKGHKPPKIREHKPCSVCCLSLKVWACWLLEITHNAQSWTKWVQCVIRQVKEFTAIIRGDVILPNGKRKVLYKSDWRKFTKETEDRIISWRQYSLHVKELSDSIIDNFHGKRVTCCPKCLQDHLIKDVVAAHETMQALTEAMNCAGYWQRCLDTIVEQTCALTQVDETLSKSSESEAESDAAADFEELNVCICKKLDQAEEESGESIYEIEEIEINPYPSLRQSSLGGKPCTRRF